MSAMELPTTARLVRVFKDPLYRRGRWAWETWENGNRSPYTGDFLSEIDAARDARECVYALHGWREGDYELRVDPS